ncbi:hypothetical protein OJF2_15820 [Aquisphaera giovannonii]|uniref:DUF5658 domain-containing protein n=1 Tax=Aquisphaera giovannonii TaxID=406548 RepID=A0A5B9VZ83_9BACT|nr:DUF5658 family protein [Aquisphaera giovannonii]QEH33085.1 hypothetical protein OJF2_15820 [Aquisphaera giovannonii]
MTIAFACASCGRRYQVPRRWIGRRVRCKACGQVQPAPARATREGESGTLERHPENTGAPPSLPVEVPAPVASTPRAGPRPRRRRRPATLEECRVQRPAVALLLLSGCDLFMTFALLRRSPAYFESNPVAMWFFARWNMAGMALFKFGAVGVAIAACELVERKRPGLGKLILILGCVAAAYAFVQGYRLILGVEGPDLADE